MKILVLREYTFSLNNHISEIELFVGLKKKGIDVTVVADGNDKALQILRNAGVNIIIKRPSKKYDLKYIKFIRKIIKKESIDILHLFTGNTMRNGVISAFMTRVKVVVYFGSTSLYWHDLSAYLKYLSPRVDKILCNSQHVYNHVKKQIINKNRAAMVYKGFDYKWLEEYDVFDLSEFGIPKDALVVVSIARNTTVKGVKYFFESIYHINTTENVHFVMIGKYMDTDEINDLIKGSPFKENIHVLGYRTDAIEILKASDIYVQTSLDEGLGRAITEAISLKKPVVVTDAGGCTELIGNGNGGFIVPLKDSKSIGESISELINNEGLRIDMGNNAFEYLKSNFAIAGNVDGVLEVYNSLLKEEK